MLNACRAFLILPIEVLTTDTTKTHSIKALLDCGAIGSFINKDFVWARKINTWSLSYSIFVFNVDGSPNKVGQISKIVNIVLHYNFHLEWMLLAVSSLGKQNLILDYSWLKDHSLEVD